jgi:hypothetical protein
MPFVLQMFSVSICVLGLVVLGWLLNDWFKSRK